MLATVLVSNLQLPLDSMLEIARLDWLTHVSFNSIRWSATPGPRDLPLVSNSNLQYIFVADVFYFFVADLDMVSQIPRNQRRVSGLAWIAALRKICHSFVAARSAVWSRHLVAKAVLVDLHVAHDCYKLDFSEF